MPTNDQRFQLEINKRYLCENHEITSIMLAVPSDTNQIPTFKAKVGDLDCIWNLYGRTIEVKTDAYIDLERYNILREATKEEIQDAYLKEIAVKKAREPFVPPLMPSSEVVVHPSANDRQHGGDHYKKMPIQPWDFIVANDIGFLAGNAIKYVARYKDKNGIEDLKKAIHFIEKLIEVEEENEQVQKRV